MVHFSTNVSNKRRPKFHQVDSYCQLTEITSRTFLAMFLTKGKRELVKKLEKVPAVTVLVLQCLSVVLEKIVMI